MPNIRTARTVAALALLALAAAAPAPLLAQESESYRLEEHALNAGGTPEQGEERTSASFRVTLDSLAGPLGMRGSSAGYGLTGGIVPSHAPASEVTNLLFTDGDTLVWDPHLAAGSYRLYREGLAAVGPGPMGACLAPALAAPTADDAADPAPGQGFAYLVTVRDSLGDEGTAGASSVGASRARAAPCP